MNKQAQKPRNVQQISFLREGNSVLVNAYFGFWFNESEIRSVLKSAINMVEFCRIRGLTVNVFFSRYLNQSYGGDNLCVAETGHNFDIS